MATDTRYAVGAIVLAEGDILLVRKVKMMAAQDGPVDIDPIWDFPKGGVESVDSDLHSAVLRELSEEVGSREFHIVRALPDFTFSFDAASAQKLGVRRQVTKMFHLDYHGDRSDLAPQDEEIDDVRFVPVSEALQLVTFANSRAYIAQVLDV